MASITLAVTEKGKHYIVIGRTRYPVEVIDETHYRAAVPLRRLSGLRFRDLPLLSRGGEDVIVEILPLATRGEEEFTYRVRGLMFYDNLVIWRTGEKGYVYLEKIVQTSSYAYSAWMPLGLYTYIASRIARRYGYSVEVSEDPGYVAIETEKAYGLDHVIGEAVAEAKNMDNETAKTLRRLSNRARNTILKMLSQSLGISIEELGEASASTEKSNTVP